MTERPANLPNYRRPPVDEVAVAVQFPAVEGLQDSTIREFWLTVRDDYPIAENQPRIESPLESLETLQQVQIQLPVPGFPSQGRMWMISVADDFLIQVQNTRFIQNWRSRGASYGHFSDIRDLFWTNYRKFKEFLANKGLPQPQVQQVEVNYFDWIPNVPMAFFLRPAAGADIRIFDTSQTPEDQSWSARYLIPNEVNVIERLYVQCARAVRPLAPGVPGHQMVFTFRAARESGVSEQEIAELIDAGRIAIVEAFTSLTTPEAQEIWERYK